MFEGDSMSDGGILMPDSFKKESNKGEIVAVGGGTKDTPMRFKKGDVVHRVKDHGIPVDYSGELLYFMNQNTILAYD